MSAKSAPFNPGRSLGEALALQRQGQLREAEKIYARVLKAAPDNFDALNLLGAVKLRQGRAGEAERLLRAAVRVNPRAAGAWSNLGQALHALKQPTEALECLDRARALAPDDVAILNQHANVLLSLGRAADALAEFQQVVARVPQHAEAHIAGGLAQAMLGFPEAALAAFDAALQVAPGHPGAHYNRGVALLKLGRYAEAVAANDRALAAAPDHANAWLNRGKALAQLNRYDEAIVSYDRVLALRKDDADAHFNAALALLTRGDYARGFENYEWRWRRTGMPAQKSRGKPLWLGEYPLARKTILLHAEQGLGDTIQFARYVPLVAASGAKVVLEVPAELKPLLRGLDGAAAVIARGEVPPPYDVHCPLGSLPLAYAHRTRNGAGANSLSRGRRSRSWPNGRRGSASSPARASRSPGRAIRATTTIATARLPFSAALRRCSLPLAGEGREGASFISIQRDVRGADAAPLAAETRVTHIGGELQDFSDTAAVLALVRSRHRGRYRRRASRRRHGPAGLGAGAVRAGLALDAARRNDAVVPDRAAIPAERARRLGWRHCPGRRRAWAFHAIVEWAKARSAVPTSASTKSQRQHVGTLRLPTLQLAL